MQSTQQAQATKACNAKEAHTLAQAQKRSTERKKTVRSKRGFKNNNETINKSKVKIDHAYYLKAKFLNIIVYDSSNNCSTKNEREKMYHILST